jgi:hypothetical protein
MQIEDNDLPCVNDEDSASMGTKPDLWKREQ